MALPKGIGKLRQWVAVEAMETTRLRTGEDVPSWSVVFQCWASVEPTAGNKRWEAQQQTSDVSHAVTIRYRTGVTDQLRIVHEGRVLWIRAVLDFEERHEYLTLLCSERADGVRNHG